jgi:hypothetical protein
VSGAGDLTSRVATGALWSWAGEPAAFGVAATVSLAAALLLLVLSPSLSRAADAADG